MADRCISRATKTSKCRKLGSYQSIAGNAFTQIIKSENWIIVCSWCLSARFISQNILVKNKSLGYSKLIINGVWWTLTSYKWVLSNQICLDQASILNCKNQATREICFLMVHHVKFRLYSQRKHFEDSLRKTQQKYR